METQPTQHGLMQIFSSLGLATDNSLTALEGQGAEGKGFAGLLSGYLPSDTEDSAALTDEGLPLLGQTLPLEVMTQPIESHNQLTASLASITPFSEENLNTLPAENDSSTQVLEEQGFYAQSLVSSLIGNAATTRAGSSAENAATAKLTSNLGMADKSANAIHAMPLRMGTATNSPVLTASELDDMGDETTDRFLGSEPAASLSKPKKSSMLELFPTSQTAAPLNPPTTMEANVSLALALNEDPVSQSLDELIDGEVIEKGELEAKSNTLERKQDDQTLKLSKGQQAWGDALAERITMNAAKDIKQVTIHLDPPELGSLELKLQVKDDQQTQVQVQVQNPQVKEALESSAHRLRDMLASQGLELSEFDVQTDSGRGDQSSFNSEEQGQGQSPDSDTSENPGEEISVEIPKAKNNNLLDTFV